MDNSNKFTNALEGDTNCCHWGDQRGLCTGCCSLWRVSLNGSICYGGWRGPQGSGSEKFAVASGPRQGSCHSGQAVATSVGNSCRTFKVSFSLSILCDDMARSYPLKGGEVVQNGGGHCIGTQCIPTCIIAGKHLWVQSCN